MSYLTSWNAAALILALAPLLGFGFAGNRLSAAVSRLAPPLKLLAPAVLAIPYFLVAFPLRVVRPGWLLLYLLLPVAIAASLSLASHIDPAQRGHMFDFLVLFSLGLAVDLRWFEPAWPYPLAVINKLLLLDAGLYGFLAVRRLDHVGFDLRLKSSDWKIGLREFVFYAPLAVLLGLAIGFLHPHSHVRHPWMLPLAWIFTFFFIALPEEVFFRGWMQNLLERRIGKAPALIVTAALFGLSHFNKRALHFNWRYVLLAAIAGLFYGRAWRQERRIGASTLTHATVDTVWGALLR